MADTLTERLSSGIPGLDEVLGGGLVPRRAYMIRGGPGTGKTILGLHFLTRGGDHEAPTLFITLGEREQEIRSDAAILGFDLGRVRFLDLSPTSDLFSDGQVYDIFSPAEVERDPTTRRIREQIESLRPSRILVDSMTQFRHLSPNGFQFRKQVLSFLRFLSESGITVMFTSESNESPDDDLQFLSDGVIQLENLPTGRVVSVIKFRGSDFRPGSHSLRITNTGMEVFPRLMPEEHHHPFLAEQIPTGVPELDHMLHGGIERGTITLITGPSGVGKTTIGLQFVREAARRGERSVVYVFEEWVETLVRRSEAVGIPIQPMLATGSLSLVQVEPLHFTADQFAHMVRREVERNHARVIMIDSIAGYRLSLRGQDLISHLHALAKYLQNMGVAVLLSNEVEAITGDFRITELGVSYVTDNVIFLRYLEKKGELCKALGVLKKRLSDFDNGVREYRITPHGILIGDRLSDLRGILRGTPECFQQEAVS